MHRLIIFPRRRGGTPQEPIEDSVQTIGFYNCQYSTEEDGFQIEFWLPEAPGSGEPLTLKDATASITEWLNLNEIDWLLHREQQWGFEAAAFRRWLCATRSIHGGRASDFLRQLEWLGTSVLIAPRVELAWLLNQGFTRVYYTILYDEYTMATQGRVFLSHRGVDKPMVERFARVLRLLGFEPWLDNEAMPAGNELHRCLRQGLRESCAVVFFITPHFQDERYLRQEINYAIAEKTEKGNRFAIITLVFPDPSGRVGAVPEMLQPYVWKTPATELDSLQEILRALPIEVSRPKWRAGV
jgi:hypothetical protein